MQRSLHYLHDRSTKLLHCLRLAVLPPGLNHYLFHYLSAVLLQLTNKLDLPAVFGQLPDLPQQLLLFRLRQQLPPLCQSLR